MLSMIAGSTMTGPPKRFLEFNAAYPELAAAYAALGEATANAGPLDAKTRALAKLAISMGARMEGAVSSHVRKALDAGCTVEEIRHVAILSTTTIGFPNMMAALSWVDAALDKATEGR
jgi:alkylhydroperoxidase/carboxymuconolactone decarboxylase family protein YurZ